MKLYRTATGVIVDHDGAFHRLDRVEWDQLLNREDLAGSLTRELGAPRGGAPLAALPDDEILAPVRRQEVWAAGVTYFRSRTARMEESKTAGGGSFYDRVYEAERPEIFLKATAPRVIGPGGEIRIRRDSNWNVPEPELALVVNSRAEIIGYTVGNDVSSRDIEGENPLYLPQAKFYDGSCALGPGILLSREPLPPTTEIRLVIQRGQEIAFAGVTTLSQMKRTPEELVGYLYRETSHPHGAVLLTGTGVVPEDAFTLQSGDVVSITIEPIGTLVNRVA